MVRRQDIARCDVISVHGRAFTAADLDQMHPGAVLIDTNVRPLVDQAALAQALMFDLFAGAGFACFPRDPMFVHCASFQVAPAHAPETLYLKNVA